jgi:DNA-binding CsgD family transcriptional regulator/tetratricopeptide (TPR) repeat protein
MSGMGPSLRLVGRGEELSRLQAAMDTAATGQVSAVFVRGESGVGKSRLLAEMASLAGTRGLGVLAGAAVDLGETAPLWPLQDALRRFLRSPDNDWALQALGPWLPFLTALVPPASAGASGGASGGAPGTSGAQHERPSLDVLLQVVASLAAHGPLVVLLDDMQWADQSSRTLVTYLLATLIDEPVLFAIAYRDEPVTDGKTMHDLALELLRSRGATLITLSPLGRDAVAQLLPGDPQLVDLVLQRSGGNALFVEEIVRSLRDGALERVPDTLRDLVHARVRLLPEPARAVLRTLAVGDDPVSHRVLEAVIGGERDQADDRRNDSRGNGSDAALLEAVRGAVGSGLVLVDGDGEGYRLRHGIVKDVLAKDLLPGERIGLHRQYARALERLPYTDFRTAGLLAVHWAGAQDWARALSATVAVAEDAEHAFGFAEAQDGWLRALELADRAQVTGEVRSRLRERAARAAHLAGDHDQALSLLRQRLAALSPGPDTASALLHNELGRYLSAAGEERRAVAAHADAVTLLPDDASPAARATVLLGHADALEAIGQYGDSRDQAAAALKVAEDAGLESAKARILPTLGFSLAYFGRPDEGLAAMMDGLRVAEASGVPHDIADAYVHLCNLLCGPLNRLSEGIEVGRRAAGLMNDLGLGRTYGVTLQSLVASALFRIGDWRAAGELVDAALAARPTGTAALQLRLARCRLLVNGTDFEAAERNLDALEALCAQTVGPGFQVPVLTLRAGLAMWRGRPAQARGYVARGLAGAPAGSDDVWVLAPLVWHGFRAEADAMDLAARPGHGPDQEWVARLQERMDELVRRADTAAPEVRAIVVGYRRLCDAETSRINGRSDPQLWQLAAATWQVNLHPYPAAYAHFRQAEALFTVRAHAAGAEDVLIAAHQVADRLGARSLLLQIETLARRAGVPLPGPASDAPDLPASSGSDPLAVLTERERAVLNGLAEGRTNRQIARILFISEKTVSVHVSHILTKLGVQSRVHAAMYLHRLQPPSPGDEADDPRRPHDGPRR